MEFNLYDNSLYILNTNIYQNSLVADRPPQYFQWTRENPNVPSFYTHTHLKEIDWQEKNINLILLESSAIIPLQVKYASSIADRVNTIYTHNSDLLKLHPNAKWIPGGGIWIGTKFGGGEIGIKPKTKNVSFVSSDKSMCHLHNLRYSIFDFIRKHKERGDYSYIDLMGTAYTTGFVKPCDYLSDYRYSIIFENYIDDMYFTEKILNCFATGTVPIYMGARNIHHIFNSKGLIIFKNPMELFKILDEIKQSPEEIYNNAIDAIKDNLERCIKYMCIEDYMWINYLKGI